jgi:hypothetical protein
LLPPLCRPLRIVMLFGQLGEGVQRRVKEPAKPYALALSALADPVHTVVPVAGAHQRQAVRASFEALVEGQRAMLEQTRFLAGVRRLEESIALAFFQHGPLQERDRLVKHGDVAGDLDIVGHDIGEPAAVIGDACADTAPDSGNHQC